MISFLAAAYDPSLSVIITRGARHCFFSSLRSKRLAAFLSRRLWTRTSSTTPSWSTARQSQCFVPLIIRHTSSRCHMWTAPCSQGDDVGLGDLIAWAHMSGLLARSHMSAGQGGFRDARPKHWCDQTRPLAPAGSLTSRVDRSHHLFVLLQGPASARHGCGSVAPRTRADLYAPAVVTGALVAA